MNKQSNTTRRGSNINLNTKSARRALIEPLEGRQLMSASISGNVFNDLNVKGVFKSGDPELANVRVYVDAANQGSYKLGDPTALTDAMGNYTINGLTAGTKTVREVVPAGFRQSLPSNGAPHLVTLPTSSTHATGVNFGDTQKVRVSGLVFNDKSKDGLHESPEAYKQGVRVFLDTNGNGKLDAGETSALTNNIGYFVLGNLAPGKTYTVAVDLAGSQAGAYNGWVQSHPFEHSEVFSEKLLNGQTLDNVMFPIHAPSGVTYNSQLRSVSANVGKNTQTLKSTTTGVFNKTAKAGDASLSFGSATSSVASNISSGGISAAGTLDADAQFDEDSATSNVDVTFTLTQATAYSLKYDISGNGFGFQLKKLNNGGGNIVGPNEGNFNQQSYFLDKSGTLAAGKYELIFTNNSTSSNPFATISYDMAFSL